ncbi:MAG: hypothetical protein A2W31_13915 [Planctomycetes bacterium RBG_16_64_10]|nr:MAG: hypothetical protein A2W31_13915 [Planctomycetes bacterium RBG_16_64_10]
MTYLLFVSAVAGLVSIPVELDTLDGCTTRGALAEWTSESILIDTETGRRVIPLRELLAVRLHGPPSAGAEPAGIRLELIDGSLLRARRYAVHAGVASVTVADGTVIEIPTGSVAAAHLNEPTDAIEAQWQEIRKSALTGDVLVVGKGQHVDYLEGVLGDITDDVIHFQIDGQEVPVRRSKVQGFLYYRRTDPALAEPICRMVGRDGTELNVRSVSLADGQFHVVGLTDLEWAPPVGLIERFDFSPGKVLYLSDLAPESAQWTPYFDLPLSDRVRAHYGAPRRNVAFEGGELRLGGQRYAKGLALRSRSEVRYQLPDRFRILSAVAGIDDRMAGRGHVRLVIQGDGRTLFDQPVAGQDPPRALKVDIQGVRQLTVLVDYGADLDLADQLDLCDARISK